MKILISPTMSKAEKRKTKYATVNPLTSVPHHMETSQLICNANQ